jgi:hypothetical protein
VAFIAAACGASPSVVSQVKARDTGATGQVAAATQTNTDTGSAPSSDTGGVAAGATASAGPSSP